MSRWEWLRFHGLSLPRRFDTPRARAPLISVDGFGLRLAAEGWIDIPEGPRRPRLMLFCRDPGLEPSCDVRNEWSSGGPPGPGLDPDGPSLGASEAAAASETWMSPLLGRRASLCNCDDALFRLEAALSAPMIPACAGRTNPPRPGLRGSVRLFMLPAS